MRGTDSCPGGVRPEAGSPTLESGSTDPGSSSPFEPANQEKWAGDGGAEPQSALASLQSLGVWAPLAIAAPLLAHRVLEQLLYGRQLSSWQLAAAHVLPPAAMGLCAVALWKVVAPLPLPKTADGAIVPRTSRHGGLAVAAGLLLGTGAALVNLLSMLATRHGDGATGALDPGTAALVLHVALLAPVAEELAFRGLLYRGLRQVTRPLPAAVVSSLIFAVMHTHLAQGAWALGLGLLLAFAYEQTRSLLAPMLVHALFNAVPVAMAIVRTRPDDFSPIWLALSVAGVIFACAASSAGQGLEQRRDLA
jgi:membrane protease YdiL (CAAX protease family)